MDTQQAEASSIRQFGRGKKVVYFNPPPMLLVCDYPYLYLRRAVDRAGLKVLDLSFRRIRASVFFSKVLMKLKLLRNIHQNRRRAYFMPVLYLSEYVTFPVCYFSEIVTFSYDCWPRRWDEWEAFFRRHRMKLAFISARQSVEEMQRRLPHMDILWMPECVDPTDYRHAKPLKDRSVDVLEMGRRYDAYHQKIRDGLKAQGLKHLFEPVRGQVVFPTYENLIDGLEDSKIFVCFPTVMTHIDIAGNVETATQRYFQTFASKNIPLGRAPQELIDLFGYNPVVDADLNDPLGQINEILSNLDRYQPLVDRNFQRLLEVGTWDVRLSSMLDELRKRGYDVGP